MLVATSAMLLSAIGEERYGGKMLGLADSRALRAAWSMLFVLSSTAGCALVDDYSGRAVKYNLEAEQTQDQDILLNIARASKRHPLEFTGVQTITGTASASASTTIAFPFGRKPGPNNFSLTDSVSGGPTFAVSVLDTQEFYEGILKPIEMAPIDLYVEERYSRPLLFNLFFSSIVVKQKNGSETRTVEFKNNVAKDDDLDQFQHLVDYLINIGLTTQAHEKVSVYGPALSPGEAANLEHLSRAATASLTVKGVKWCDLTTADRDVILRRLKQEAYTAELKKKCKDYEAASNAGQKPDDPVIPPALPALLYRAQKSEQSPRFCFEHHMVRDANGAYMQDPSQRDTIDSSGRTIDQTNVGCDPAPKTTTKDDSARGPVAAGAPEGTLGPTTSGAQFLNLHLGPSLGRFLNVRRYRGGALELTRAPTTFRGVDFTQPVTLMMQPRSTEGVIYYLGEVVRRALYHDYADQHPRVAKIKYGPTDKSIPYDPCEMLTNGKSDEYGCEPIFTVNDEAAKVDAFVAVSYDGERYAIAHDSSKVGRTYQVMDLLTQLLALHKSAKDLPATSVFTIISPP